MERDGFTRSLDEARRYPNSYLILSEDNGWRIGIVCPVWLIKCSEEIIRDFVTHIRGSPDDDVVVFKRAVDGRPFISGTNRVEPRDQLWIHPDLSFLKDDIEALLFNE